MTVAELIQCLTADLDALTEATADGLLSAPKRKQLDTELRDLTVRIAGLLRDLDPVRHPHSIFDPGDPAVVGRFIALAMIAQPRIRLPDVQRFYGAGVYALYYNGEFAPYEPIKGAETPIYVGKADPRGETAREPYEQGEKLSGRLKDHLRNIGKAEGTLKAEDFDCRSLVVQSGWQGAAEDYLIHLFKPIWNNETGICYGLGKHGDAPSTRGNKRSPWDTLHPGREWAWRDPNMSDARPHDQILADLDEHFSIEPIYTDLDAVLKGFFEELRQV